MLDACGRTSPDLYDVSVKRICDRSSDGSIIAEADDSQSASLHWIGPTVFA
jgi:hypothetical protein